MPTKHEHITVKPLRRLAVRTDTLALDPSNAMDHPEENVEAIKGSLRRFGVMEPIGIRDGVVIRGNGTLTALRELAAERATGLWNRDADDILIAETEPLAWDTVPVLPYEHLSTLGAKRWGVTHNQSAKLSTWNWAQLAETLAEGDPVEWQDLGWPADELASIVSADWAPPEVPEETTTVGEHERALATDEADDDLPPPPAEPITKPGDVIQIGQHLLHCCDCMDLLRSLPDNSIDAIVTDPPYGLSPDGRARTWDDIEALRREGKGPTKGFMGREWDAGVPGVTWARECLRVLKPGGHLIAHSATRTIHRLATAIEDAGFELRDTISWLHWQGFPKSLDVSKAIDAMHGAEREVIGKNPNVERAAKIVAASGGGQIGFGAGSLNSNITAPATDDAKRWDGWGTALKPACEPAVLARKPLSEPTVAANVLRWGTGALNIDACRHADGDTAWPGPYRGGWTASGHVGPWVAGGREKREGPPVRQGNPLGLWPANIYACPKPATSEREAGTDGLTVEACGTGALRDGGRGKSSANTHPTVKPTRLYRWLLRLVTPPGGTVLEPFGGSGTTLVAAEREGFKVIASEMSPAYADIIRARVEHAVEQTRSATM